MRVPFSATLRSTAPRFSPIQQRRQEDTFLATSWFCTSTVDLSLRAHGLFGPCVLSSPKGFVHLRRLLLTGVGCMFFFAVSSPFPFAVSAFQISGVSTFRVSTLQFHRLCLQQHSLLHHTSTATSTPPHHPLSTTKYHNEPGPRFQMFDFLYLWYTSRFQFVRTCTIGRRVARQSINTWWCSYCCRRWLIHVFKSHVSRSSTSARRYQRVVALLEQHQQLGHPCTTFHLSPNLPIGNNAVSRRTAALRTDT